MWAALRFNEKELSHHATSMSPDKEGLLEKKGAVRGQGYKQRWFRLKGNLLFYFRVDELLGWESTGDPVGVIVLERFKVENTHSDQQPFSFALTFDGDISRNYILRAYSRQEQQRWIEAIGKASYEKLKFEYYKLQQQLYNETGKSPVSKKSSLQKISHGGSCTGGVFSYQRSSQKSRANLIKILAQPTISPPDVTLLLHFNVVGMSNSSLPQSGNLMLHVSFASSSTSHQLHMIDSTETVQCTGNGFTFWHQIQLKIGDGSYCPENGVLYFRLVSVHDASKPSKTDEKGTVTNTPMRERDISRGNYPVKKLIDLAKKTTTTIDIQLHDDNKLDNVLLKVTVNQVSYYLKDSHSLHHKPSDLMIQHMSILPQISKSSVWSHQVIPSSQYSNLMVTEELSESLFNVLVPLEMLKWLKKEATNQLDEINYNIGALSESHQSSLRYYQSFLHESVGLYNSTVAALENVAGFYAESNGEGLVLITQGIQKLFAFFIDQKSKGFKPASMVHDSNLLFVPTNLHIQKLHVKREVSTNEDDDDNFVYNFVTFGSPTYTKKKSVSQGLKSIIASLPCSPSFVSRSSSSSASLIVNELAKLSDIRRNLGLYRNILYRSAGNAKPHEMTSAFTGISAEVQKVLALTQSSIVLEAIGDLIRARPGNPTLSFSSPICTTSAISINPEKRNLTLRRNAPGPTRTGCTCGRCAKCVPSPSDWIWNGSHYVQVSTGEWKLEDTAGSIQELLVRLLDKVEIASKKIIEQQHEAHAASTETIIITTFKPTYVWSVSLIPIITELQQVIESFIKLAYSSLSFSLMKLDSCVSSLFELKKYIDAVFCQTLTGLVTSFYLTLSEHFTDSIYMQQLKEIGFLAHFECLLNSTGEEIGLLEDMYVGVMEMKNIKFQLTAIPGSDVNFDFHIIGTRENMIIQFLINHKILSRLPNVDLQLGHCIKVVPVLFTCGINDIQREDMKPLVKLQDEINANSINILSDYVSSYKSFAASKNDPVVHSMSYKISEQLNQVKSKFSTHKSKNVEVLISVEQLTRNLKGGRMTTCKSGKDCTSMGVTLEECVLLRTEHKVNDSNFLKVLSCLRSTGTQLDNCLKNTGQRCYSFNSAQFQMLPRILRPPQHSCKHISLKS